MSPVVFSVYSETNKLLIEFLYYDLTDDWNQIWSDHQTERQSDRVEQRSSKVLWKWRSPSWQELTPPTNLFGVPFFFQWEDSYKPKLQLLGYYLEILLRFIHRIFFRHDAFYLWNSPTSWWPHLHAVITGNSFHHTAQNVFRPFQDVFRFLQDASRFPQDASRLLQKVLQAPSGCFQAYQGCF